MFVFLRVNGSRDLRLIGHPICLIKRTNVLHCLLKVFDVTVALEHQVGVGYLIAYVINSCQ